MKIKIVKCLMTVQILMSCFAFDSIAFNDLEAGAYLWKLINEARARPAETIETYGIDYERARRALGQDVWILELENGLPPLAWHEILSESAAGHNEDMINRQYYSYTSPEGLSFNDRIINSGYNPLLTGESLGILSFYIYVDPVKAVESIFENMLRDELNPDMGYSRNIFSKEVTEIGISFISTIFSFENHPNLNAYIVTADFAKPVETRSYILGNIYNLGENQPDSLAWIENGTSESYAERLLSYKAWSPEKADDSFVLWVNNFTEGWSSEVSHGPLGSYQIQMPANTFYSIDLYSEAETTPFKSIVSIGMNVNKMVDFQIK